ncbi:MAG: SCO family protein [Pirellulaceae bacterium]
MNGGGRLGLVAGMCLLTTVVSVHGGPPFRATEVSIEQKLDAQVPLDLMFRDERGRSVRLGDLLAGRPVILNLVYFQCPMLCNMALDGLIRSLRTLSFTAGEEFTVITVSFDPTETPELAAGAKRTALTRYGRAESADQWHFLTGDEQAIAQLTEAVGFHYRWDPDTAQYAHAAGLIILTPEGRTSQYLLGVEYPARDLRLSLVQASRHTIGSVTDDVLLLCYQYDPLTGRYGLVIRRVLQLGGVVTVLALSGAIGGMLWRERRRERAGQHAASPPSRAASDPPEPDATAH